MTTDAINVHRTRVRAHQTDLNAAMYHAAYFDVFDDARIETFRRLGYTYERMVAGGWTAVIRKITCEFISAARMDDVLTVTVTIADMTRATMVICYDCCRDGALVARARAVFAFVESQGKPIRLPPDLRQVVEENRDILIPVS